MHLSNALKISVLGPLIVLAAVCGRVQGELFTAVDISSIVNARLQVTNADFPSGAVTLGGVPFVIGSVGNNYYYSAPGNISGPTSVDIGINLTGVTGMHTLINTAWGENAAGTFASLAFNYSDSTSFIKTLDGNSDIRDFYDNVFTNSINGTTTQNVFLTDTDGASGGNQYRLDKQFIDLSAFSSKTLVSMTLTDNGGTNFQRTFLSGVTAESITAVPEPSSLTMAMGAVACLVLWRRRSFQCDPSAVAAGDRSCGRA